MTLRRRGADRAEPPPDPIRVLVVEDSPTVRTLLVETLQGDPEIRVVGVAEDGVEAVRQALRLKPDLITMDVNMPGQDGLEATREIMSEAPTPIIIVSATASREAVALSLDATQAGALMVLPKPDSPLGPGFQEQSSQLVAMVKAMARVKVVRRWHSRSVKMASHGARNDRRPPAGPVRLVAIGCSTGGPAALNSILSLLPASFPAPILVVQHMARGFVGGLASWLDGATRLRVRVVTDGEPLEPGTVYLAADERHLGVGVRDSSDGEQRLLARLTDLPPISGFRPSATHLFMDAARALGSGCVGVVLTGMGDDGVAGLRQLHDARAYVIGQDEASSVVYGMAREAVREGVVDELLPAGAIAGRLMELVR